MRRRAARVPDGLDEQVDAALAALERRAPAGGSATPTTRCWSRCAPGARDSMPGMLDTVLNLGLNDDSVEGLAARTGNERFAWDSYRRLRADVRQRRPRDPRRALRGGDRGGEGASAASSSTPSSTPTALRELTATLQAALREETGEQFPQDPREQLARGDPRGVRLLERRARGRLPAPQPDPRRLGHRGQRAADGVRQQGRRPRARASPSAATRSPARPSPSGDFLANAQGEDVVSGRPQHRATSTSWPTGCPRPTTQLLRDPAHARAPTTATCRTSSSRSRRGGSTCSRRATRSGRRRPRCASPSTRSTRGCSTREQALATIDADDARRAAAPDLRPRRASTRC